MIARLADALLQYTQRQQGHSPYLTAIEGVGILRSDHPRPPLHMISRPSLCIVAQGAKWASIGNTRLEYRAGQALLVGIETPSVGRVRMASPDAPCLVLAMELDLAVLRSVLERMPAPPVPGGVRGRGVFIANVDDPLAECALRLVNLLDRPGAIPVVHPLILQEICFWLLAGPQGDEVARLATANPSRGVIAALHAMRANYQKTMLVEELAEIAQMSASVFHRNFKELTALSPMQYLKRLRLLEARRLMAVNALKVETAAYEVGYESASQFSREYARLFGAPPKRDMRTIMADRAML
ncbi:AraC family transcriptional regulator [Stakelama sp. CBK3Z-3]|uniref:AraC family transcriptional regulator n=1 Tax=Stakelama flava TaxID=2860338 RepID=A0ABS6XIS6_9SPHN|nr:AraC family transcriptional regulator [Stakelama flava]MBW4330092.1 AraC family transcriptional regulator [Stakelama flava]